MPKSFNPLDYSVLSASLANELMTTDLVPLSQVEEFYGNGVYALFYTGDFKAYEPLAKQNRKCPGSFPIYVGKAAPSTRKGATFDPSAIDTEEVGKALYRRVANDHRKSVEAAENLNVEDFTCRLLVLNAIWVPLAEAALIARYSPAWNSIIDGFGNHDPGKGRGAGKISRWDVLHPGRGREKYAPSSHTLKSLEAEAYEYLSKIVRERF